MKKKAIVYSTGARSLYIGKLERQFKRSSAQASLLVSLEDALELKVPGRTEGIRSTSFLIPAGVDAQIDTHGANVTLFFLDNLNTDFSRLLPKMHNSVQLADHFVQAGDGRADQALSPVAPHFCYRSLSGKRRNADRCSVEGRLCGLRPVLTNLPAAGRR